MGFRGLGRGSRLAGGRGKGWALMRVRPAPVEGWVGMREEGGVGWWLRGGAPRVVRGDPGLG